MTARHLGIDDETVLMPNVIAECVVAEVESWSGKELKEREKLADWLATRARHIYQNNQAFRKKLRSKGNSGRDTLYAFMRHWLAAQLKGTANGRRLPSSFANGIQLTGGSMPHVIDTRIAYIVVLGNSPGTRIGIVKYNESGYYATTLDDPRQSIEDAKTHVRELNKGIGVPDDVADAMHNGSLFGWHVPAANKAHGFWSKEGK